MIVVFGSLNVDLVLSTPDHPRRGETVLCSSSMLCPGGKGANQAVAAARAGAEVAMVGRVGDDALGAFLIDRLVAAGLDVSRVGRNAGVMTGCASVAVDRHGENVIYVAPGANAAARADDVAAELLAAATTVICQMEVAPGENWRLLARAKRAGTTRTILNLAPARDLDQVGLAAIKDWVDVLVVNRQEATQLAAHAGRDLERSAPGEIVQRMADALDVVCVLTLGGDGACASDGEKVWVVPALPVAVKDTTGAGDAFVGVLAAMLDEGRPLPDALRFASVAASLACRQLGAQESMPERRDIERHVGLLASG